MCNEVLVAYTIMDVVLAYAEITNSQGHDFFKKIIMIPTYINDFAFIFWGETNDVLKEIAVLFSPLPILSQLPAVDNITI